jgi:hypothetical protein
MTFPVLTVESGGPRIRHKKQMSEYTEHQLVVSSLLDALSRRAAVLAHNERVAADEIQCVACACSGRKGTEPVCSCLMQWVHKVGKCWYQVKEERAEYLCCVGWIPVARRVPV